MDNYTVPGYIPTNQINDMRYPHQVQLVHSLVDVVEAASSSIVLSDGDESSPRTIVIALRSRATGGLAGSIRAAGTVYYAAS